MRQKACEHKFIIRRQGMLTRLECWRPLKTKIFLLVLEPNLINIPHLPLSQVKAPWRFPPRVAQLSQCFQVWLSSARVDLFMSYSSDGAAMGHNCAQQQTIHRHMRYVYIYLYMYMPIGIPACSLLLLSSLDAIICTYRDMLKNGYMYIYIYV